MILAFLGGVFLALCITGALIDVNRLTIPNWLNLSIALLFIPAAAVSGLPLEIIGGHLVAGLAAFVIAFALFAFRLFGGGDAKMIPAVILWLGPGAAMTFLFFMALSGGLCALLVLSVKKVIPATILPGAIRAPFEDNAGIPYGVAIAIGAIMSASLSPLLTQTLTGIGVFG